MKKYFFIIFIFLFVFAHSANADYRYSRFLRIGKRGEDVRQLQMCMNRLGYATGRADGIFGRMTARGVRLFQRAYGLRADALIGRKTGPVFTKLCSQNENTLVLKKPQNGKIYFSAFPDFGGSEDQVSSERIEDFEKIAGKKIAWAMFSQNWYDGIQFPKDKIEEIRKTGSVPFVRMMARSSEDRYGENGSKREEQFSLQKIIDGDFDRALRKYAQDVKRDGKPLIFDFDVEPNGNWFLWSGIFNGSGHTKGYGDPHYPDGPERWRDAYRHIIDIFRGEGVHNVTWFFHPDIHSVPNEWWNQAKYYYPGDDYIDWIGVSVYGALNTGERDWELFSDILADRYQSIREISRNKPFALIEFGVTDGNELGDKATWLRDAFQTILAQKYIPFSAINYWHENWEEEDESKALLRIDSSRKSMKVFQGLLKNERFLSHAFFGKREKMQDRDIPKSFSIQPGISWQWDLSEHPRLNYDVDLYDIDLESITREEIKKLHEKGKKVICYFNAGAWEPYRDDASLFSSSVKGKVMEGWEDERWLDIRHFEKFSDLMKERMNRAKEKGCDGIEPDNIDGYQNDTGFSLSYEDQLRYNKWLAREAHKRGLLIALKNDLDQIDDLVDDFDFAINEECFQYHECDKLQKFIQKGKVVLGVEYQLDPSKFCTRAKAMRFSWMKKPADFELDHDFQPCL